MNLQRYRAFGAELTDNLGRNEAVLGLVATGSMAEGSHLPDEGSDHDFWVVTAPGHDERLRLGWAAWLPSSDDVALVFQETPHGMKALYRDGHLVEYAVFSIDELHVARANDFRILLDRADIGVRMQSIRAETQAQAAGSWNDERYLVGQFATHLLIAAARARRGELLSAHTFVAQHALTMFVRLVARRIPPAAPDQVDDLDPFRRFERCWPQLASPLAGALTQPPAQAAHALLDLAERSLADQLPSELRALFPLVRDRLAALATR